MKHSIADADLTFAGISLRRCNDLVHAKWFEWIFMSVTFERDLDGRERRIRKTNVRMCECAHEAREQKTKIIDLMQTIKIRFITSRESYRNARFCAP